MAAKPTLAVVAKACGVSTSTVSRAWAGDPWVRAEVRARIEKAAGRHGYRRNELVGKIMAHVRARRTQQFLGNLAMIHVPSPGQPRLLPAQRLIMAGAGGRAKALGFQRYEFSAERDAANPERFVRVLRARRARGDSPLYRADRPDGGVSLGGVCDDRDRLWAEREPVLHTVCLDHYMTLTEALVRRQAPGYRRIGLFLSRCKDERIAHKWSAAFAAFQRSGGGIGDVPLLIPEQVTEGGFVRWHRKHRPDLVIGHLDEAVAWLQRAGARVPDQTAFFNLSWTERKRPCAGLDLRLELQGEVAAETIIAQIQRGEHGLPPDPLSLMVRGRWVDGPTLAKRAAATD